MMTFLKRILKRMNFLPMSYDDEHIDASIEESYRQHAEAVNMVNHVTAARNASNDRLRRSIEAAKKQSNLAFAEFELSIQHRQEPGEDRFPHV